MLVAHFDFVLDNVVVLVDSLLGEADGFDFLAVLAGGAVENRHFGSVELDQGVVDSGGVEGGESVLDSRDADVAAGDGGAAGGVDDVFSEGVDYRFAGEVDALELVAVVFGSGEEFGFDFEAGMQTFAFDGKLSVECLLFHSML